MILIINRIFIINRTNKVDNNVLIKVDNNVLIKVDNKIDNN